MPATTTTTTPAPVAVSAQDLLDRFAAFWMAGDWETMAGIAEPSVVAIAEGAGQADDANPVWGPSCEVDSAGSGNCELLYTAVGDSGPALIYSARYATGPGGAPTIVELLWVGDAG